MGHKALLLTQSKETIGQMSCNPAIGGVGKGHLVKEIDALGGVMALAADHAGIHFKTLNASKGRAVQATRAQADRTLYKKAIQDHLNSLPRLSIVEGMAARLIVEANRVLGVETEEDQSFYAKHVILTVGTFLNGKIYIGNKRTKGGRVGDEPSIMLADQLREIAPRTGRLKTGTPPRLLKKSINFSVLEEQAGDNPRPIFSFLSSREDQPKQVSCFIAYTNKNTHSIIKKALSSSPLFTGAIEGVGPRYCPSIEDKVTKFIDKTRHQIFIEPEGLFSEEVYPNGISTSLSLKNQESFVRSIAGFENAVIAKPGYAIEYDYFDPRDLKSTLETSAVKGLFFAGQINGTTGYEEAAAQGILAGINAGLSIEEKEKWVPDRSEAYIGVLTNDLVTRGTNEPYRMFTSRAEHRLLLREDNADTRLTPKAKELSLIAEKRWKIFCEKQEIIRKEKTRLSKTTLSGGAVQRIDNKSKRERGEKTAYQLLKRPHVLYKNLLKEINPRSGYENETELLRETVDSIIEADAKYQGYMRRQHNEIEKQKAYKNTALPKDIDYQGLSGLSNEAKQKLIEFTPDTIGQAARIQGITHASLSVLLVHLKKHKLKKAEGL
jgi:tRNA uridine 5-carboxymethylaminomethyl modification enzyme